MKRSEVVDSIKCLIEANIDTLCHVPDASLIAHGILYYLEETVEMLPPYDTSSDDECPEYSWEPENE